MFSVIAACSSSHAATPGGSGPLRLTSSAWADGQLIPADYACIGAGKSPPLAWTGTTPSGTHGWALVVQDVDTKPVPFVHWVVTGLGTPVRFTQPDALPTGAVASQTTAGAQGWTPPCPPPGAVHHYRFTVYALHQPVTLAPATKPGDAILAIQEAAIANTSLTGTLGR
jgi:Raf kinase inhibitor-like YbhB/YbcL family protein